MSDSLAVKNRHPTLAADLMAGAYEPPDDLFKKDRRRFAEEVRRLEDRFKADALEAVGLRDHPLAERVLRTAQNCAATEDRMRVLFCLIQIADLLRAMQNCNGGPPPVVTEAL